MNRTRLRDYDPHVHIDLSCPHCGASGELCGYLSIVGRVVGHVRRILCAHPEDLDVRCRSDEPFSLN